jgi:SAM-dependent methyltransferase
MPAAMESVDRQRIGSGTWPRLEQPELLDLGQGSPRDVAENLAEMQRINDWLGGTRALTRHLYPRLLASSSAVPHRPLTVIDLGTGGASLPLMLTRWARRQGIDLRILAVDWSHRNLSTAAGEVRGAAHIQRVQADAAHLPLAHSAPVDVVISSLLMHHLEPDMLVRVLREAYALAGQALIMTDLVRGRLPYLAFKAIQPLFARNYLTRHDGALSVRRAYTPGELRSISEQAGLRGARVICHFPWRMTLVADK